MPFVRDIADKVIDILLLFLFSLILLEDERLWSAKTIMKFSDGFGVTKDKSPILRRKFLCKLMKFLKTTLNVDGRV